MSLKLKIRSMFPALVSATSPLTLLKVGLAYTFGLDISALRTSLDPVYKVSTTGALVVAPLGSAGAGQADYVLDGNGDEVEINNALGAAASGGYGREVHILAGNVSVNAPITMQAGVTLSGVKGQTNIIASAGFITGSGIINCPGISNFVIQGISVDGRTNNVQTNGIVCAPALLFSSGALTGTPCSSYVVRDCGIKVKKAHCYHQWNVRSQDFTISNNTIDGGYTSADTFTNVSSTQEGIECVGTKRGSIINNRLTGVGNAALNFPTFPDLSIDMGHEDMIVSGNICKTVGTGILSYLYSDIITGDLGGMLRCRFLNNTIVDWYVNGIDVEISAFSGGGPVPFQGNDISHNMFKGAASGQPAYARAFSVLNSMTLADIASFSNTVTHNDFINCLSTNAAGYTNIVGFSGIEFTRNNVRTPAQGAGSSCCLFLYESSDIVVDNNRFDGGRASSIDVQGTTSFSIINNTCLNWNGSAAGNAGILVEPGAGPVASTNGDVQGNRFKTVTLTSINELVRFTSTCDQINFNLPNNRYIGSGFAGFIVNALGSGTYNSGSPLGYVIGSGGAVTQATSKATGVTLNKASGAITLNNAALAAATIVSFVLTDSAIAATDVLILNHISGGTPGAYSLNARCAAGSATIDVRNNTAGSLSEAIVIQFALVKAVSL